MPEPLPLVHERLRHHRHLLSMIQILHAGRLEEVENQQLEGFRGPRIGTRVDTEPGTVLGVVRIAVTALDASRRLRGESGHGALSNLLYARYPHTSAR
jgi:hypothetical protein